ncbi:octopamine receptor 2-like [Anoplopoma fimbria]|uniref:octopamine receptor 2-like n=1 Tax=Anoplopoma fimbria TaxID=229290 RepID=UPI0023EAB12C|nr:octopamine receptor 2-like [Anoplopoma fimbria]
MRGELTPAWDSGNKTTTWEDYIDTAFVVANSLILLITSSVGIAANVFVILAVYNQKSLQTAINALVVNLAVIDILRCVIDCPILFAIVVAVYQRGHVDELICDTQVISFSFNCCIQLLTLTCISAERYQAIAQPFQTSQRRRRIMVQIPLTWILAILVSFFCLIFLKDSPVHVKCKGLSRETSSSYDTFGLYMLFPLWAACFTIIILFYASIFAIVRSHNRKIFDKGAFRVSKTNDEQKKEDTTAVENGPGKSEQNHTLSKSVASEITDLKTEQPQPSAMQVEVQNDFKTQQSNSCGTKVEAKPSNGGAAARVKSSTTIPQVSSNFETEKQSKERVKIVKATSEMKETSPRAPSSAQLEKHQSTSVLVIDVKQAKDSNGGKTLTDATADQMPSVPPISNNVPEKVATIQSVHVEGAVCMMPSKASRERVHKKKESQMAKRVGYITLSFLLFWLPLITTILMNFVMYGNKNTKVNTSKVRILDILSVSVTCITSLSDPIIYAAVNPQFQTEFYRIKNKFTSMFK